jgi:thymidylate kinase
VGLLKLIWAIAPKPDVVFLLDAPPQVIQSRKQEVTFEETAAQVQAYRTAIGELPIGMIIDASQPRPKVAAEVEWIVLDRLAERVATRFSLKGQA